MKIATAAIITKQGRYLIAKRKRGGVVGGKWEFPGGKKEKDETLKQCLVRELEEELGIEAQIGEKFDECVHSYKTGKIKLFAYWVEKFDGQLRLNEHDEIKWVNLSQLVKYDFTGNDKPLVKKLVGSN